MASHNENKYSVSKSTGIIIVYIVVCFIVGSGSLISIGTISNVFSI